jgi:predicted nuclease of predicted toxin-antitoxin system
VKLLLDEMLDYRLARPLSARSHQCVSVKMTGLNGLSNGELLNAAERLGYNVLVTLDQNIEYQTNLKDRKIAILTVCCFKNTLSYVLPHVPELLRALDSINPGEVKYVGEPRLVRKHTQT